MKTIATVVAVLSSLCASVAQMQLLWDREYSWPTSVRYIADARTQVSEGVLMIGQPFTEPGRAYARAIDSNGQVVSTLLIFASDDFIDLIALHPIDHGLAFVQCSICRTSWTSGFNLFMLTSSQVMVSISQSGYYRRGQLQQDGSLVVGGLGPQGTTNQWTIDRWRWGQTEPDWSTTITAPMSGGALSPEFPSNMRTNLLDTINPTAFLRQTDFSGQAFWFSLTPDGQTIWTQNVPVGMYLDNVIDEEGNRYIAYHRTAPDGGYSFWWTLLKSSPTGQILWDRDIGLINGLGNGLLASPKAGRPWLWIKPTDQTFRIHILDPADGSSLRVVRYDAPDQRTVAGGIYYDYYGSPYLLWGMYGAPPRYESHLHKLDEDGNLVWGIEVTDLVPESFHQVIFDSQNNLYLIGPSRIQKWRILAVFVEGDASGDGCIDDKDLAMTLEAFGTNDPFADFDSNGIVDDRDLERVLRNFGLGCAG
ncbi:MAG: hypothetical protein HUU60_02495 [Armatimonadetes bacterium]|nr:hypothetical protein [Armatimonadota bacterium]